MLSAGNRLRRRQDVLAVIQRGRLYRTKYLNIYRLGRADQAGTRLACVVGKKVHQSAVRRHQVQRWLREIARGTIQGMQDSVDMVWVAKPSIVRITSKTELEQALSGDLKKILA